MQHFYDFVFLFILVNKMHESVVVRLIKSQIKIWTFVQISIIFFSLNLKSFLGM